MTKFNNLKLKHLSIIFSVLGISVLYVLSILAQPTVVDLCDIKNFENKNIIVEGFVKDYYNTQYGNQIITIVDNNSSAIIFLETTKDLEYGDKISATGKVQKFGDDWEIVINNNKFVKIIEKWTNISTPIWELAQNPEKFIGLNINVSGTIDSIFDDYFYITDEHSTRKLIVFFDAYYSNDLFAGEKITAFGKFGFDETNLRYGLYISESNHKINT